MKIIPFKPEHVFQFDLDESQVECFGALTAEHANALASVGYCYSAEEDGKIIGCGGVADIHAGRSVAWAIMSEATGKHMLAITRAAKRVISLKGGRVEAVVRYGFVAGVRWATLLGLEWHHHEEQYLPGGYDADIFVRLDKWHS